MFEWLLLAVLGALAFGQGVPTTAPSPVTSRPAACDTESPRLRAGWQAFCAQEGKTPDEMLERLLCQQLAARMGAAYASLSNLTFESRMFEGIHHLERGEAWKLAYDEDAPLIARVKCHMRPADEMRAEAFVNEKLVWTMVSSARKNGRSSVVQWNDKKQTGALAMGSWGRSAYCDEEVPGHCTLGAHLTSLIGRPEEGKRTQLGLFKERIAAGRYEGMVRAATGESCHCVAFVVGKDEQGLFRYYVHPKTYLLAQVDKIETVQTPAGKVIGVASARWTYENVSTGAVDDALFEAPDPRDRTLVDAKP